MQINTVDLSDVELEDENTSGQSEEQLQQEWGLGEIVEVEGEGAGIIAAFVEEDFEFPVGQSEGQIEEVEDPEDEPEMEEIEASSDDPMYIVALQDGGSVAAGADEISSGALEDDEGEDIEDFGGIEDEATEVELAEVYGRVDNPSSAEELKEAKREMIMEQQVAHLADYVEDEDMSLEELGDYSYEELQNIRGVDDPHTGFNRLPNGWTRKSVLQAYASLGASWSTCYPRMIRVKGPNFAKRWCAALKDEVLRTESWRNSF